MATLTGQTIASSYEQLLHVDRDGGGNSTTLVSIKDGDNGTTFGFQISTNALMMTSTNQLQFGDTGTYIYQSADGVLDLVSDTEIEINATTIDINGAVDISGNTTIGGDLTVNGTSTYINSTTLQIDDKLIELAHSPSGSEGADTAIDGGGIILKSSDSDKSILWENDDDSWHFNQGIVVGDNDLAARMTTAGSGIRSIVDRVDTSDYAGFEVQTGGNQRWFIGAREDSTDNLQFFNGNSSGTVQNVLSLNHSNSTASFAGDIDLAGSIDVDGTANLDNTDIDGTLTQDAGNVVFNEDSGDYDFRIESNGNANMFFVDGGNDVIGIGTNSPDTGHLLTLKTSGTGGDWIKGEQSDGGQGWRIGADSGDDAFFELQKADASQTILLSADGDSHFSGGNVGIGTAAPSSDFGFTPLLHLYKDGDIALVLDNATEKFEFVMNNDTDILRVHAGSISNIMNWDASSGNVSIGAAVSTELLHVQDGNIGLITNQADANDKHFKFYKSRNATDGSHTVVQDGDDIGSIEWYGSDGNSYEVAAGIKASVDGTPGSSDMPGRLVFSTTADGANSLTERMRIDSSGNVGIGTASPDGVFHVESSDMVAYFNATETYSAGASGPKLLGQGKDSGGTERNLGYILFTSQGSNQGEMRFAVRNSSGTVEDKMIIDDAGNVGIGTTSPSSTDWNANSKLLHMYQNDTNGAAIKLESSNTKSIFATGNNQLQLGNISDDPVKFYTNSVSRFVLDSNSRISLSNNDSNTGNTVFGYSAFNTSSDNASDNNVAIGHLAMGTGSVAGADYNTVVGYRAGDDITSGDKSVYIGAWAGDASADVDEAIAVGYAAMGSGTTTNGADGTTAIGYYALNALTSGGGNVAVGYAALDAVVGGSHNTAIGYDALTTAAGNASHNTAVGRDALKTWNVNGDGNNTAVGSEAGAALTTGVSCVLIGAEAGKAAQDVDGLVLIGDNAGKTLNSSNADNTVAVGRDALVALTSGNSNVAVGAYALDAVTVGDNNTAVGQNAGGALNSNDGNDDCTLIGAGAGLNAATATATTAVGYSAGRWYGNSTGNNATGYQNRCTFIGSSTQASSNTPTNQIVIGDNATGQGDNYAVIGDENITRVYMAQDSGATVYAGGIQVGSPAETPALGIQSDVNDLVQHMDNGATTGNVYIAKYKFTGKNPDDNTSYFLSCEDAGTDRLKIWSDGDVNNADNAYGSISDKRIKQGIRDANSQWDDIKAVKVRNFKKNEDVDQYGDNAWEQIGVIAQELEASGMDKLIKEHPASENEARTGDGSFKEGDMIKSVSYSVLYMKAIKALQEAMAKIETLESKVAALEGK